jgi:hypothetical protein
VFWFPLHLPFCNVSQCCSINTPLTHWLCSTYIILNILLRTQRGFINLSYRTDVWWAVWFIAAIWNVPGKSLVLLLGHGEACSSTNRILKRGHFFLSDRLVVKVMCSRHTTRNVQISVPLSQFPYSKHLPYMNDTAHNIVQLNRKTVYGSEVAFCIWRIGWSGGLVFQYC